MLKQGKSQLQIRQKIYEKLKVSSLGENLTIRDRINGGGCRESKIKNEDDINTKREKTQEKKKLQEKSKDYDDVKELSK